jgi:hypothetical protein
LGYEVESQVGDRLWVKETTWHYQGSDSWHYSATEEPPVHSRWYGGQRPSIFMPRAISRITLEITEVRAQRVQDISEEDAKAEGVSPKGQIRLSPKGRWIDVSICRLAFRHLWDHIYAGRGFGWDANPWVRALTFRRVEQ